MTRLVATIPICLKTPVEDLASLRPLKYLACARGAGGAPLLYIDAMVIMGVDTTSWHWRRALTNLWPTAHTELHGAGIVATSAVHIPKTSAGRGFLWGVFWEGRPRRRPLGLRRAFRKGAP